MGAQDSCRKPASPETERPRWFAGVPIGTNAFILKDLGKTLAILWAAGMAFALLVQGCLGAPLFGAAQLQAAFTLAGYLVLFIAAGFCFVAFILFGNHYVMLFRFTADGIYCETMKGKMFTKDALHCLPFPHEPVAGNGRSVTKTVKWNDVTGFSAAERQRAIILRETSGKLTRLYCPDAETYRKVLSVIRGIIKQP